MPDTPDDNGGADQQQSVSSAVVAVAHSFEGPLPPPDILAGYESVLPGSAERILQLAEQESAHRRDLVASVVEAGVSRSRWGLWLGAVVAVAFLGAATAMVLAGHPVPGTIIGTADLASVVGMFIYGTWFRGRELRAEGLDSDDASLP